MNFGVVWQILEKKWDKHDNMRFDIGLIKKIVLGFWAIATLIVVVFFSFEMHDAKNNSRYYTQGLEFVAKKDYQNAYYNFSSAEQGNEYYCPAKYRAALAAQNLYDTESAASMYKAVVDNCSGTIFAETSKYSLGKMYFEQKNYKKASSLFAELIDSAEIEKYSVASNYFLAKIEEEKKPNKAKSLYLKYLEAAPDGKYAKDSIEGVQRTKELLSSDEHYIYGLALFKNGMYKEAKENLSFVPFEKSWYYLVMSLRAMGERKQIADLLEKGLSQKAQVVGDEEIQKAIDIFALYAPDKQTGYLNAANMLLKNTSPGGDYAIYKYIGLIPSKSALPYYYRIESSYPNGNFASLAQWQILHAQYKKGNYKEVIALADAHSKKHAKTIAAPRVLFFAGKAAEKSGNYFKAKSYYNRVLAEYPDDYYAFRAKLLLDGRPTAWTFKGKKTLNKHNKNIAFPLVNCSLSQKDRSTLDLLIRVGDYALIEDLLGENQIVKSWVNYKQGNKAMSIVQARDFLSKQNEKPAWDEPAYKLAYPLYYEDEINKYAHAYDLDAYLVLSIIKEESHFDNRALSYVGAGGLMQVMPDTARFISEKYGFAYNPNAHNDVEGNIRLGCAYLDYALGQLSKKYLFAVAGYNGGHNAVKNWQNNLKYSDFDEFVEEIPYEETQTYIRKVFKTYWNYLNIYDRIN